MKKLFLCALFSTLSFSVTAKPSSTPESMESTKRMLLVYDCNAIADFDLNVLKKRLAGSSFEEATEYTKPQLPSFETLNNDENARIHAAYLSKVKSVYNKTDLPESAQNSDSYFENYKQQSLNECNTSKNYLQTMVDLYEEGLKGKRKRI